MEAFKIGDRVKAVAGYGRNPNIAEKIGTVIMINHNNSVYSVEYDEYIDGHDAGGYGSYGYCWNHKLQDLEHACEDNKIIVTLNSKTATAKLYNGKKLVKASEVIYSSDKFNLERETNIIIDSLFSKEEEASDAETEKFYTGNVVCIKNTHFEDYFKVGKIYEIINGEIQSDHYCKFLELHDIEELSSRFPENSVEFLEITE